MKILVIRFKEIGDVLLTSVLCNSLKTSFPQSTVDYLVGQSSASMLEGQKCVDHVFGLSNEELRNPLTYLRRVLDIRKQRYDIIIDATSTAKSGLISLFSQKSKYRIGRDRGKLIHFYTHLVPQLAIHSHKIQERLDMLGPLLADGMPIINDDTLVLRVAEQDRLRMRNAMVIQGLDLRKLVFTFSVSGRLPYKKWRLDFHAAVAAYCIKTYDAQILLYSDGPTELLDVLEFAKIVNQPSKVFFNIVTPTLKDLAALMINTHMFIGNECGPRHISQALEIPSVAVYSPCSEMREWLPSESAQYRGVDWRGSFDKGNMEAETIKPNDGRYQTLYDSISPERVIAVVDEVVRQFVLMSPLGIAKNAG